MVDPATLIPHPGNPRIHDKDALRAGVARFNQYKAVTVNRRTGQLVTGHGTVEAIMAEHPGRFVQVSYVDVDDDTAAELLLWDNQSSDLARNDPAALAAILTDLEARNRLANTGFEREELAALIRSLNPGPILDPKALDDLPPPSPPRARPGDIFTLGRHRVICGDSGDPAVVRRLLGGDEVSTVWTDPPYGVDYEGGTRRKLRIRNDQVKGLRALLDGGFGSLVACCPAGVPVYVASPSGPGGLIFEEAFMRAGLVWRQTLVWVKSSLVLGHSDYQYRHEAIMYGQTPDEPPPPNGSPPAPPGYQDEHDSLLYGFTPGGEGRLGRGGERWYGNARQTSVLEYPKPQASEEHPTMKPVALIEQNLGNSCPPGGVVLDLYAGSGSTLIAAHQRNASARLVELDPIYVDVICTRWEALTGQTPERSL
jgi:site-specific DNA-methyltransferase (adenine-specific)